MWFLLAVVLIGLPLLSRPGRIFADTHDVLWFDPGWYLRHSFSLWQSNPFLQGQSSLGVMAAVVGLFRLLGAPVWVAQRLWYGVLLFVAAAGTVVVMDEVRGRRTVAIPLLAAAIYALGPYTFGYGLLFSGQFPPFALLPMVLAVTMRWIDRPGLLGPALLGLTVFAMGGGNGAPQAYALVPAVAYGLWVVLAERRVSGRRALAFAGWSLLFVLALNSYWLISLGSRDVSNALLYSEQPRVINFSSSFAESIRGLGFWQFYGGDQFGPWTPTVRRFLTSPLFILSGFLIPLAALGGAWVSRIRVRLLFVLLAILGVVGMAGVFPPSSPTPFGHLLLFLYEHVPAAGGLRTTYKLGGTLTLSLAVLAALGVERAWWWLAGRGRNDARLAFLALVVLVVAANSFPLWTGGYRGSRSTEGIPAYWNSALGALKGREGTNRAFFAPGSLLIDYRWGGLMEGVSQVHPSLPSVIPWPFPVGDRYQSNLVSAVEQPYQLPGLGVAGESTLLRYLGVKDVVLQNDVDWQRGRTARPASMQALLQDPSIQQVASFGLAGQNTTASGSATGADAAQLRLERQLPPAEILTLSHPLPPVRAESGPPVVLDGDGFGISGAAAAGMLDSNPPVLYAGQLGATRLAGLAALHPSFVITDSNRRRTYTFNGPRDNRSYTLQAGQTLGGRPTGYGLFGDRAATQSVAVLQGVRSITASSFGSPFSEEPEYQPANAFDGDPSTWWLAGALGNPLGAWVQEDFLGPVTLSRVRLSVPDLGPGRRVDAARLLFSDGSSVETPVRPGDTDVSFPARRSSFLRVEVVSMTAGLVPNGVGFSDISMPGVFATKAVAVPRDLTDLAQRSPAVGELLSGSDLTYLFQRARAGSTASLAPEEAALIRLFEVPGARSFDLSGQAHLAPESTDQDIDALLHGKTGPVTASSSSRLYGDPALRASEAFDGRSSTAWVPNGGAGQWLQASFPARTVSRVVVRTQLGPGRSPVDSLRLSFSDGSAMTVRPDPLTGIADVRLARRSVDSVRVTIRSVVSAGLGVAPPVGVAEVEIPGVRIDAVPRSSPLPCSSGQELLMDGLPLSFRLRGTARDLLAGRSMALSSCSGGATSLAQGAHELTAVSPLQADTVILSSPGSGASEATAGPATVAHARPDGGYDVRVSGAGAPFFLTIGQDYAPGWAASVDGHSLGPPLVLDGYSAGWLVQQTGSFTITVRYRPQRIYEALLLVSAVALLAALIVVGFGLMRSRRRRAGGEPT